MIFSETAFCKARRYAAGTAHALLLLYICTQAAKAAGPGSTSLQIMKTDLSARALGQGGGFVSVADDAYAGQYNPAGLGQLTVPEAAASSLSGFENTKIHFLAFAAPLPFRSFANLGKPVFSFSVAFTDAGNFVYRPIDAFGGVTTQSMDAERNEILTLSYGEKVALNDINISGEKTPVEQYLGASAKYIHSRLLNDYSASAFAFDAGWLAKAPDLGLSFGLTAQNYGSGIKYNNATDPLPLLLRCGASYQRPTVQSQTILFSLESDFHVNESLYGIKAGAEYRFEEIFTARFGYKFVEENSGPVLGLGIRHLGFSLDFAMSLVNTVYNTAQLGLSYKFTGLGESGYKRRAKYKIEEQDAQPLPKKRINPARQQTMPKKPVKAKPPQKENDVFWIYQEKAD